MNFGQYSEDDSLNLVKIPTAFTAVFWWKLAKLMKWVWHVNLWETGSVRLYYVTQNDVTVMCHKCENTSNSMM